MTERFLETARQVRKGERERQETRRRIREGTSELYAGFLQVLKEQGERVFGGKMRQTVYLLIAPLPKIIWGEGPSALRDWHRFSQTLNGTGEPVRVGISSSDATRRPGHILISSEGFPYYWEINNRGVGWRTPREAKRGEISKEFVLGDVELLESLLRVLGPNLGSSSS